MEKKNTYTPPEIKSLGDAREIIRGGFLGKEVGGDDTLRDINNNPVSIPG